VAGKLKLDSIACGACTIPAGFKTTMEITKALVKVNGKFSLRPFLFSELEITGLATCYQISRATVIEMVT